MSTAPAPSSDITIAPGTLAELQGDGSLYYVTAVNLDYVNDASGDLRDIIEVHFSLVGRGGDFSVHMPFDFSWADAAAIAMAVRYHDIETVYATPV